MAAPTVREDFISFAGPYEALAEGRRVIFYDQFGCGNSAVTEPHGPIEQTWVKASHRCYAARHGSIDHPT
jgi:pimeloyl-ACP methyl ester carboxylesterase